MDEAVSREESPRERREALFEKKSRFMLNAIRVAAANWLGRAVLTVIMGLLIVSFAIWGIGDIFRGGVNRTVATVGSAKISADEYRAALNTELRRIQMQVRRAVTMEEARAFGLDRELLNRKIDEAALSQEAGKLGLALGPELVLGSIMDAPEFKTAGQFDRAKLGEALSQAGLSEKDFVRVQEDHLKRLELYNGLVGGFAAPRPMLEAINTYRAGTRDVAFFMLDPARVAAPPASDEAAIKAYYEAHKAQFRTVELRKATLLTLSIEDFARDIRPSEAELKAYYEAGVQAGRIGQPERRALQRVLFDTEAEAKAALVKLATQAGFETLMGERKLAAADVDFGQRTRGEIPDAAQRDAIFAAKEGEVLGPFKDTFGFVVFRLGKVTPAAVPGFEETRASLEPAARADKIARDAGLRAKVEGATKAIEDARTAGKSLADAAKAAGLTPRLIDGIDKQGKDGAGRAIENLPGGASLVSAIFASDIGLDNEPITEKDGSHLWYEVNGVEPARERALDDVRAEVTKALEAQARDKALLDMANGFIKRIGAGETLEALAKEQGVKVESKAGVRRGQAADATLGGSAVDRIFSGPVGQAITALAADGAHRLVLVPVKADVPAFDAAAMEKSGMTRQVAQSMADDLMSEYTARLRQQLGVSINQPLLNQTLGQAGN